MLIDCGRTEGNMKDLEKITTEMMEHVCNQLCWYPKTITDQEQMDDICAECKMGQFVCDIINPGNTNFERLSVDSVAEMLYKTDDLKGCDANFDDDDVIQCRKGLCENQDCKGCIREWLLEEAID